MNNLIVILYIFPADKTNWTSDETKCLMKTYVELQKLNTKNTMGIEFWKKVEKEGAKHGCKKVLNSLNQCGSS